MARRAVRLTVTLHGSLAWTGQGHGTPGAVIGGLCGLDSRSVDPETLPQIEAAVAATRRLRTAHGLSLPFEPGRDILLDRGPPLPRHPNAMTFRLEGRDGGVLGEEIWYSTGGGFIEREGEDPSSSSPPAVPFHFTSADHLLTIGVREALSIAGIVRENESALHGTEAMLAGVDAVIQAMLDCIERGLSRDGILPGGLRVERRAKALFDELAKRRSRNIVMPTDAFDHASVFAIAVNEENAAGGRVVTAPTNGAAGVIPAVLRYYRDFCPGANRQGMCDFIFVATAIGGIVKRNASISGAEVGCQGEVGSAAAMAAAGLAAALGGSNAQIENAAEIALEHHLGMTCDPIGGLVQIPCIERNAFGAVKAITAASLALNGDGSDRVSLDQAIETMRQTGCDMHDKYRETSRGGLAVNVPEC
jgi:L-serine dehydratase